MPRHDSGDGWVIFTLLHPVLVDNEAQRRPAVAGKLRLCSEKDLSATQTAAGRSQLLRAARPRCPIRDAFYCCRIQIQDFPQTRNSRCVVCFSLIIKKRDPNR